VPRPTASPAYSASSRPGYQGALRASTVAALVASCSCHSGWRNRCGLSSPIRSWRTPRRGALLIGLPRGQQKGPVVRDAEVRQSDLSPVPELLWPTQNDPEDWGPIDISGWSWHESYSDDENLLNLAYVASLNTKRSRGGQGVAGGLFGAVLCRPPRSTSTGGRLIEVLGLGFNFQPRFAESGDTSRQLLGIRASSLHAEVMVVARCARDGVTSEGSWLYTVQPPCWECSKALLMAGVARMVFQEPDREEHFQRQRKVAAATLAEWLCVPASEDRRQFLEHIKIAWSNDETRGAGEDAEAS